MTFRCDPVFFLRGATPSLPGHRVLVQYKVIRLSELEGQRILDAGHAGLIAFTPLMKPPEGMASQAWLRRCMHAAHARPMAQAEVADYLAGMSLLSGLVYAPETISDVISAELKLQNTNRTEIRCSARTLSFLPDTSLPGHGRRCDQRRCCTFQFSIKPTLLRARIMKSYGARFRMTVFDITTQVPYIPA